MSYWVKRDDGIWDAPNCHECCSDCSACSNECYDCPLDSEGSCDNCIFKDGYTKCRECCTNPRTKNDEYVQMGYWWMCDDCIEQWIKGYR